MKTEQDLHNEIAKKLSSLPIFKVAEKGSILFYQITINKNRDTGKPQVRDTAYDLLPSFYL